MPEWGASAQDRRNKIFAALEEAAESALEGKVDAVLIGGDLFDRPDPEEGVAQQALHLLASAAEAVPVVAVPGYL